MQTISFAEPGTLRNLTSENAPITAMPVPTLPFTSIITICTIAWSKNSESRKLRLCLLLKPDEMAIINPSTSDVTVQIMYDEKVKFVV